MIDYLVDDGWGIEKRGNRELIVKRHMISWIGVRTCLACSSVSSSEAFIPLRVMSLRDGEQNTMRDVRTQGEDLKQWGYRPRNHSVASLPLLATLESRVSSHEFLQDRMKLIFSA